MRCTPTFQAGRRRLAIPFLPGGGVINRAAFDGMLRRLGDVAELSCQQLFYGTAYSHLAEESPFLFAVPAGERRLWEYWAAEPSSWGFLWAGKPRCRLPSSTGGVC